MTDKIRTLTVILDEDYRSGEKPLTDIMKAIEMLKGVIFVSSALAVSFNDLTARRIVKNELRNTILELWDSWDKLGKD